MVKKTLSIFILILLTSGCGITKRQHLSGWYFPPIQKHQSQVAKGNTQKPELAQSLTLQEDIYNHVGIDTLETNPPVQLSIEETKASIGNVTEKIIFFPNSLKSTITHEKINQSSLRSKTFTKEKSLKKQIRTKPPELSKGGKIFWLTILFTVLFAAFVICGALWPEAYIIWFGITALIALFGASTGGDPGSLGERIGAFFLFVLLGLFYLWIYLSFPLMWPAIGLQLLVYGAIGLISLIIWGIMKKKKKK